MIRSAKKPRKKKPEEELPKYTICLPHVSRSSRDMITVCRMFDTRTVFTTISTLKRKLTRVKDVDKVPYRY